MSSDFSRPGLRPRRLSIRRYSSRLLSIDHHLLPWVQEVFLSLETKEISGKAAKASREAATKNITNSQNDQLLDGLLA